MTLRKSETRFVILLVLGLAGSLLAQGVTYNPQLLVEMWRHGARAAARNTFN